MSLLASYIERIGLSQAEFARRVGIPAPMICQWANGTRRPGLRHALALERATAGEVPASHWVDLDDTPAPTDTDNNS